MDQQKRKKKTIEQEINDFLDMWHIDQLRSFLYETLPLFELYDVDDANDWVRDSVGDENTQTVRLIRTVYLISRIASFHSSKMAATNFYFKDLWKRIEKEVGEI